MDADGWSALAAQGLRSEFPTRRPFMTSRRRRSRWCPPRRRPTDRRPSRPARAPLQPWKPTGKDRLMFNQRPTYNCTVLLSLTATGARTDGRTRAHRGGRTDRDAARDRKVQVQSKKSGQGGRHQSQSAVTSYMRSARLGAHKRPVGSACRHAPASGTRRGPLQIWLRIS